MTAEKIVKLATEAMRSLAYSTIGNSEQAEKLFNDALNNPEDFSDWTAIYNLAVIRREALEEIAAKNGRKNVLAACKAIIRNVKTAGTRPDLAGAWEDEQGWQVVCDGYRAIRLASALPSLPVVPASIDISRTFDNCRNYDRPLPLPTVGELKAFIAAEKAAGVKIPAFDFGDGLPLVNAAYLLDMLKLNAEAYVTPSRRVEISPIYFKGDNIEAMLLPIRKNAAARRATA